MGAPNHCRGRQITAGGSEKSQKCHTCICFRKISGLNMGAPAQQLISFSDNNNTTFVRRTHWEDHQWNAEWADNSTRLRTLISDTSTHTPGMTLPRRAWVRLNSLRTGVGRFRSCLYKWGMASSAACECGAEQTVDNVVLHCPIHRPPHGLHGLRVLDDETPEWLLNTCPDI